MSNERTPAVTDPAAINHLGAVVHHCRPTWDPPGIRAALEQALGQHPYRVVAPIAVGSALDPKAHTPAVIVARCANGWNPAQPSEPPTRIPPRFTRCARCNQVHTAPDETCYQPAAPYQVRIIRAQLKAIRAADPGAAQ